ncbi:hypothetical protein OTU49_002575, partial [Cherax quadricarinatus]
TWRTVLPHSHSAYPESDLPNFSRQFGSGILVEQGTYSITIPAGQQPQQPSQQVIYTQAQQAVYTAPQQAQQRVVYSPQQQHQQVFQVGPSHPQQVVFAGSPPV